MIKSIKKSGAWKKVNIDNKFLSDSNFEDLISFEELHDYEFVDQKSEFPDRSKAIFPTKTSSIASESKKQGERKRKKSKNTEEVVKKKSKPTKHALKGDTGSDTLPKPKKKKVAVEEDVSDHEDTDIPLANMDGWADLFVPKPVLRSLHDLGYMKPTSIQEASLPAAIRDRRDIVGAAETGSGKTLAFAIPIIHRILEKLARAAIGEENDSGLPSENSQSDDSDNESDTNGTSAEESEKSSGRSLNALIVTPTRELAIQIKDHINAIITYTEIKVGVVVGGLSIQKQQRILKRRPHIVVATPGRLWELIQQGEPYLNTVADVDCLVIDEADRMVEKGHFQELTGLFNMLKEGVGERKKRRQTFVFSATLTLVHTAPQRLKTTKKKKKVKQLTSADKLDALMEHIGLSSKPKVIDLSSKRGVVQTLNEVKVSCAMEEKDIYLYDVLLNMPGRTLVFCNSKDSVRRLAAVFTLLIQPPPLTLHADMHQKQRLKFLDRFAGNKNSVMLATDVAARGLDIKHIDTVVHYQVPSTCENYVHRSGRTARASQSGTSILMVCPQEVASYQKILKTLNRDKDLPPYSVDMQTFVQLKERVVLARKIDQHSHRKKKIHLSNNWFQKAAQEMDLILDESLLTKGDDEEERRGDDKADALHAQLTSLLRQPLGSGGQCRSKYPTQSGKLYQPATGLNRTQAKKTKTVKVP